MKQVKLYQGDNMKSLDLLPDNSIDSVVTDGPYGLKFMSKRWDYEVPSVDFWKKVYQKLKPGGHVLSFGGTRTYHRMVVNMEDAGFEIRDQIMWIYGSGFPKSHNIGKSFDKKQGNEREVVGTKNDFALDGRVRKPEIHKPMNETINSDQEYGYKQGWDTPVTKGSSQYEGWGTALKPANEPICLARKPLSEKTIVDNVIKWGTGGINIDGCRIGNEVRTMPVGSNDNRNDETLFGLNSTIHHNREETNEGRFPANILFDETAAEMLDNQMPFTSVTGKRSQKSIDNCIESRKESKGKTQCDTGGNITKITEYANDKGGASRFFYVAKVGKKERNLGLDNFEEVSDNAKGNGLNRICDKCAAPQLKPCDCKDNSWVTPAMKNSHPTLKPINLMTYLCRLITPPGGIILDPFMGSGSTGISACLEGFRFVGMELQEDYFKIAEARINNFEEYRSLLK